MNFLREREALLNKKVAELLDMVARLTSKIRAEDSIYRKRYLVGRSRVYRLKQKLDELNESKREDEDYGGDDNDDAEGASELASLATEANAFLSKEMETEMREGMERRSSIFNPGEPSHHDRLANVKAKNEFSGPPARATIPPMSDDDYFSPMSTHGDHEDIDVRGEHAIAFPFEPYDLCDDVDLAEEEDITNTDIAGASAFDKS